MSDKKNTIGRFEIIEKIGEGPIGAVYKALDPVIRRTVAIKVIKLYALEESATFADVFEKIYRVVRTSTQLNHPNICIIYDLSEEKKIPYITMEFVEGQDLETLLQKKHQFKRSELFSLLQQVCDALDFAHKKGVIHQDLKSTNILISSDLHVKITDFGIAGLDEIAAAQTKKLLSIPYYISPEQALGEKVSAASDLFSLGVITYQLLCGQLPFPGTSAANVIMMIARDNPAAPKDLQRSGMSREDWDSFFSIALAKAPNQRFRTAKEMLEAISAIIPPSETGYYPYVYSGDSSGKFEKTYVSDSPTMLLDAGMVDDDQAATMMADRKDLMVEPAPAGVTMPPSSRAPGGSDSATVLIQKPQIPDDYVPPDSMATMAPAPPKPAPPEPPPLPRPQPPPPPKMEPPPPPPPPVTSASAPTQMIQAPLMPPPPPKVEPPKPQPPRAPEPKKAAPAPAPPPPLPPAAPETPMPPLPSEPPPDAFDPAAVAAAQARKPAGPPNMGRYMIAAAAVAFFILVVGAGIYFLRGRKQPEPTPAPVVQQEPVKQPEPPKVEKITPPAVTAGQISITTDPVGATVFINEEQKGVTPLVLSDVPLGTYVLKLQLQGFQEVQQEVQLTAETNALDLPFTLEKAAAETGILMVESSPPGATVVIGKRAVGVTPKKLANTKVGKYTIILKLEGYEDFSGSVRVQKDQTATLRADLKEIPKPKQPEPVVEQKPVEPEVKPGQLVPMGPDVKAPKAIKKVSAKYPEIAKQKKLEGVVSMSVLVSETGKVLEVKITKSAHEVLDEAAMAAVREWVYEPATKKGVPVKVWIPVSMAFQKSR